MRKALTLLAVLGGAVLAPIAAAGPGALDDQAFWQLIDELSEPSGDFADDNFVSNELGLVRVLPELERRFDRGGVYIGVGPEQNFSYIAALEPELAFIVDIRRQNLHEQLMYKALFEIADNRADFLSLLFSRPRPTGLADDASAADMLAAYRVAPVERALFDATRAAVVSRLTGNERFPIDSSDLDEVIRMLTVFYSEGPDIAYVYHDTDDWHPSFVQLMDQTDAAGTNWSFLGSGERYTRVRELELENRVVPVVGDFAGPKALRAIGDYLRGAGSRVNVFYVSNVEPYLFEDDIWRAFYDNVAALPLTEDSIFIRTFFSSTARACSGERVITRAPLIAPIAAHLDAYAAGRIDSVCTLVPLSH